MVPAGIVWRSCKKRFRIASGMGLTFCSDPEEAEVVDAMLLLVGAKLAVEGRSDWWSTLATGRAFC